MRLYRPIIRSRYTILGSDDICYPAYLDTWVPLFGIFSLWRPVTSVKMNGYLRKLNPLFVWILSIDWYLNWPHWTFFIFPRCDALTWTVHMKGEGWKNNFFLEKNATRVKIEKQVKEVNKIWKSMPLIKGINKLK